MFVLAAVLGSRVHAWKMLVGTMKTNPKLDLATIWGRGIESLMVSSQKQCSSEIL